jgi:hypothetical protein
MRLSFVVGIPANEGAVGFSRSSAAFPLTAWSGYLLAGAEALQSSTM